MSVSVVDFIGNQIIVTFQFMFVLSYLIYLIWSIHRKMFRMVFYTKLNLLY